ncbi:hypothetical protein EGW08_018284, partial [Elysia chlorotica]
QVHHHKSNKSISTPAQRKAASDKEASSINPFQNVELTPPSKVPPASLDMNKEDHSAMNDRLASDFMDTDDFYIPDDSGATSSPTAVETIFQRPIIRAKRSSVGRTMAERFRNFWNKKQVGPNLKSIFSKSPASKMSTPLTAVLDSRAVHSVGSVNLSPNQNTLNTTSAASVTFLTNHNAETERLSSAPPSNTPNHSSPPAGTHHTSPLPSPPSSSSSSAEGGSTRQIQHRSPDQRDLPRPGPPTFDTPTVEQGETARRTSSRLSTLSSSLHSPSSLVKRLPPASQFR